MIEPFFFGRKGAFACYHPSVDPGSTKLLVVCPPFFDEYRRCYRALSELANACAAAGVHVLRVDYFGTGDAQGLLLEATVQDWIEDVDCAVEEGLSLTGADRVILLGVRFGATIAAQCQHQSIERYIFWDPIETGEQYLGWLNDVDAIQKLSHMQLAREYNNEAEDTSYICFELNTALRSEIGTLSMERLLSVQADRVWVVATDEDINKAGHYRHCEFGGFHYDWPAFHEGNFTLKPVLERLASKVLM